MSPDPRYRVELAAAAERQLRRLPPGDAARLRTPILALAIEPRPAGITNLVGTDFLRLRVGQRRLIYLVDEARLVIVLRVARRAESTYRRIG